MSEDGQKSEQSFDVNALEVYVTGDREQTDIRPSNNSKLPNVCVSRLDSPGIDMYVIE